MLDELDQVREHLNNDHGDTVGLVGRFLARSDSQLIGPDAAATATFDRVDASGIDITVRPPDGSPIAVRHGFSAAVDTIDAVRMEFFAVLTAARDWAGEGVPLTSLERELSGDGYRTFVTEVVAVTDIAENLRQISFGRGLDEFETLGGDQFLYVLLPPRGRSELTVGADFSWNAYEEMADADRPAGAYYSVRRWRPDDRELDMWFVLHGDEGASAAWPATAAVGDPAALWGPRRAFEPPATTGSHLIVVDETGFGAACAVLDELLAADPDVRVDVVAEHDGPGGRVELPTGQNVDVRWVDRAGGAPGGAPLVHTVAAIDVAPDAYAFGAAESRRITQVRRHLRDVVGLAPEQVSMTGYWRAT